MYTKVFKPVESRNMLRKWISDLQNKPIKDVCFNHANKKYLDQANSGKIKTKKQKFKSHSKKQYSS